MWRILIVDDDSVSRRLVSEILKPDAETSLAANGDEAIRLYEEAAQVKRPYDVVFLDIQMPQVDGGQVLDSIRKSEKARNVPCHDTAAIIMLSNHPQFKKPAFATGCDDYIVKPIDAGDLRQRIAMAIERRQWLKRIIDGDMWNVGNLETFLKGVVRRVKEDSGFDGVSVRVKKGNDYPYLVQEGFSEDFLKQETSLLPRSVPSGTCSDALECICGSVISRTVNMKMPYFTNNGSFWTNSIKETFASFKGKDLVTHLRGKCADAHYESVGLFPLDAGFNNVGLLQLNTARKGAFSEEGVKQYEFLASCLAKIVMKAGVVTP